MINIENYRIQWLKMNWDNTSGRYFTPSLSMSESYITMVSDAFAENIQNQVMGCDFYNNQ